MGLRVTIVDDLWTLRGLRSRWNELAGDVFHTFEWQEAWWRHFEPGRLVTVTLWDGPTLVAIFPFSLETLSRPVGTIRALKFAGSARSFYREMVARGYAEEAADALVSCLSTLPWDQCTVIRAPHESRFLSHWITALQRRRFWIHEMTPLRGLSIPLPQTFAEYLARLSKDTRQKLGRYARGLAAEGFQVETGPRGGSLAPAVEAFFRLHFARMRAKGVASTLAPVRVQAFLADVLTRLHDLGWVRLFFLTRGEERIAADLSFFHAPSRTAAGYQSGMAAGRWGRFGPGKVLRLAMLRQAIAEGLTLYDEMAADEYKLAFKPVVRWYRGFWIAPPRPRSLMVQMAGLAAVTSRKVARRWGRRSPSPLRDTVD